MNHFKSSLSMLAAVASIFGSAACGGSNQTQASAPSSPQTAPPEQNGSAMGQPTGGGEPGTESGMSGGASPSSSASPQSNTAPSTMENTNQGNMGMGGGSGSTTGTESTSPYGTTGGSPSGSPGTTETRGAPSTMAGSAMDTSGLSDGQFAGVMQAINQAQIQRSLLAQTKASSPEVKRFARQMVSAYRTVQTKEAALFAKLQTTPADSPLSTQIRTDEQTELSTLQSMKGKDFDRSYMDAEVQHLNNTLEVVDHMMSEAKSPELKAELQHVRAKVETHVRDAERVQQGTQPGGKTSP